MKVLFDTNVLYAAFTAKGFCEEVVDEAVGDCAIVWSKPLQAELENLLQRKNKTGPGTRAALTAFANLCEFCVPSPLPKRVCRDPDDDAVLEALKLKKRHALSDKLLAREWSVDCKR